MHSPLLEYHDTTIALAAGPTTTQILERGTPCVVVLSAAQASELTDATGARLYSLAVTVVTPEGSGQRIRLGSAVPAPAAWLVRLGSRLPAKRTPDRDGLAIDWEAALATSARAA
jgi:hypothetical protein